MSNNMNNNKFQNKKDKTNGAVDCTNMTSSTSDCNNSVDNSITNGTNVGKSKKKQKKSGDNCR